MYVIKRDGGNANHGWRTILTTEDREAAEKRFDKELEKMRQGGVILVEVAQDEENVLRRATAPRLRARY
jgi:hypothetical protein